jgi:hypothetical protein
LQLQILFFLTKDHHDGLITCSASEICGEGDIRLGAQPKAKCSGHVGSLTRGVRRCHQLSGDKY